MNRRDVFRCAAAGVAAAWASCRLSAQPLAGRRLTEKLTVLDGGGANVVAFFTGDAFVLVDSGAPNSRDQVIAPLRNLAPDSKVQTVFNTHYHID